MKDNTLHHTLIFHHFIELLINKHSGAVNIFLQNMIERKSEFNQKAYQEIIIIATSLATELNDSNRLMSKNKPIKVLAKYCALYQKNIIENYDLTILM